MAALRLRLAFEYPPPLLPVARLCWLLLPAEQCRVVADLESIIRRRFGFSRRTRLHLFLDGCLLPPNESVLLVRDNDSIRVKQEELAADGLVAGEAADGLVAGEAADGLPVESRKRNRHRLVETHSVQSESRQRKKRRKVAELSEGQTPNSTEESASSVSTERSRKRKGNAEVDGKYNIQKKHCRKRKDKWSRDQERIETSGKGAAVSPTSQVEVQHAGSTKRSVQASDSDAGEHMLMTGCASPVAGTIAKGLGSNGMERKRSVQPNAASTSAAKADGSTDTPCSDSETTAVSQGFPGGPAPVRTFPNPSESGDAAGCQTSSPPAAHCHMVSVGFGRGRGRGCATLPQGGAVGWQQRGPFRGRGRGTGASNRCPRGHDPKPGDRQEPDTVYGASQNLPKVPKRDYSKLPLLAAPPQVGERIAFKVLELSENYTPELSDYKEGRIVSYDAVTQQVELSVESLPPESSKEPGKFDLIYQSENGEAVVEYAVTREPQLTQSWSSLVDPRLIVTPAAEAELAC